MERPPLADAVKAARVRDFLVGGTKAYAAERNTARGLEDAYPGLGSMIRLGVDCHRKVAGWAVAGGTRAFAVPPAAGAVFAGGGFAARQPLHSLAAAASPAARFVYSDPDELVTDANEGELAGKDPGRVTVITARSLDPGAVLGAPACRELAAAGPVSVHLVMTAHRWPPAAAAAAVAGYARMMPAGSTLCMTLGIPDDTAEGRKLTADLSEAVGPTYGHTADDVAGWLDAAGLEPHPDGIRPAWAFGYPEWADAYRVAPAVPGRIYVAVAVKR